MEPDSGWRLSDTLRRAFSLTPYGRGTYQKTTIDAFSETGGGGLNLAFDEQDNESLTSTLGAQASYAISTGFGVLLPTIYAEWVHEFRNDQSGVGVRYAADPTPSQLSRFTVGFDAPDRNYFNLGVGLAATLPNGWSAFGNFETVAGLRDTTSHVVTLGGRLEF